VAVRFRGSGNLEFALYDKVPDGSDVNKHGTVPVNRDILRCNGTVRTQGPCAKTNPPLPAIPNSYPLLLF